ncbi:MAG: hypothetical protein COZ34_02130 [Candidatus Pacebacteria bacterium CG_4_10_14_3_um_filter_34_15]|nr:hypothetical protein [Candidatus Paceibacterota bacterium]PIX81658.1 MAG: hypothetical protein COZ34_02130 [Candidatus Pacebacteria bacterium CG_4_10_14_3_um_filter_34_15]PJC43531.1 MAG: hypothetical protein CO039_03590 [Candidatus Pacebacteria bacterium CG_4_9_14_0_2_um_filter_34_50]
MFDEEEKGGKMAAAENDKLFLQNLAKNIEANSDVPSDVIAHVQENLAIPTSQSSICVDGGYTKEQAEGELARPGADLGISISLIKLGLSPEEAFLAVYDYRVKKGQKYGWHTDTHVDPEDGSHAHSEAICGCGHCNVAYTRSEEYGVEGERVAELLIVIKDYQALAPANMRFVNLDRDHNEKGILVVNTDEITVYPWDKEKDNQFFVYDSVRDAKLLNDIVESIKEDSKGKNITFEQLKEVVDQHTGATLGLLGSSKGKPMYKITINDKKLVIELVGNVPIID